MITATKDILKIAGFIFGVLCISSHRAFPAFSATTELRLFLAFPAAVKRVIKSFCMIFRGSVNRYFSLASTNKYL